MLDISLGNKEGRKKNLYIIKVIEQKRPTLAPKSKVEESKRKAKVTKVLT